MWNWWKDRPVAKPKVLPLNRYRVYLTEDTGGVFHEVRAHNWRSGHEFLVFTKDENETVAVFSNGIVKWFMRDYGAVAGETEPQDKIHIV